MPFEFIETQLAERKSAGYYRQRTCLDFEHDGVIGIDGQHYLNFASNDYLGLRQNERVMQAWVEGLAAFGAGSGASPLVTGYTKAHRALEATLADGLERDAVLLFSSGYAANQAICQALFAQQGMIFSDKLMHASFLDGAMACGGDLKRFAHNDMAHLSQLLDNAPQSDKLLASEGVFSMDGDAADVRALVSLAKANNAWLMLDDAHGFGVLGESGFGTVQQMSVPQQDCQILMGTFGKAVGTAGAFIAGSQSLIDYLVNYAKHYIYSTAMPAAQAVATLMALELIQTGEQRSLLEQNIAYFRQRATQEGILLMASQSAIQPIIVGHPQRAVAMSQALKKRGLWVSAMRHPTVPKGTDRLRVTLSAKHVQADIDALVDGLVMAMNEVAD